MEGSSPVTGANKVAGPTEWGKGRRLVAALLVAFSMVGTAGVVFAGTASAQTSADAVLQWLPQIQAASAATGIGAEYIAAVIRVESGGDPNAVSSAGAIGLMQVMPYEFQSQGIPEDSWYDPATNIMAGSKEIAKHLAATGSIDSALASYFGSGCDSTGTCTGGYISTVLSYAAAYAAAIANGTAVDLSGVSATGASTIDTSSGIFYPGTTGEGAWQGDAPPTGDGDWTGDAPVDAGPGGVPPQGDLDGGHQGGAGPGGGSADPPGGATGGTDTTDEPVANG